MKLLIGIVLGVFVTLVCAEVSTTNEQNKPIPILDKDVEDAKERWIPNMDENDEDEDIMQHPIDEGPRRVSLICLFVFLPFFVAFSFFLVVAFV